MSDKIIRIAMDDPTYKFLQIMRDVRGDITIADLIQGMVRREAPHYVTMSAAGTEDPDDAS